MSGNVGGRREGRGDRSEALGEAETRRGGRERGRIVVSVIGKHISIGPRLVADSDAHPRRSDRRASAPLTAFHFAVQNPGPGAASSPPPFSLSPSLLPHRPSPSARPHHHTTPPFYARRPPGCFTPPPSTMPPEPRRNSRKVSADDEIELKRARGEISCAECRRYVPCSTHAALPTTSAPCR